MLSIYKNELESTKKQIIYHRRRLNLLKEKKARQGINVDPEIIIEIEDIETEIAELEIQLKDLVQFGINPSAV